MTQSGTHHQIVRSHVYGSNGSAAVAAGGKSGRNRHAGFKSGGKSATQVSPN